MRLTQTHTYAILEVAPSTYDDIRNRLIKAEVDINEYEDKNEYGNVLMLGALGLRKEK